MDCKTHFDITHQVINLGNPKTAHLHTGTARHTLTSPINPDNPKTAQLCTCATRCTLTSPINLIITISDCFCIVLFCANKQTYCIRVAYGSEWVTVLFITPILISTGMAIKFKNCTDGLQDHHQDPDICTSTHLDWKTLTDHVLATPPPPPPLFPTHSLFTIYTLFLFKQHTQPMTGKYQAKNTLSTGKQKKLNDLQNKIPRHTISFLWSTDDQSSQSLWTPETGS